MMQWNDASRDNLSLGKCTIIFEMLIMYLKCKMFNNLDDEFICFTRFIFMFE